MGPWDYILLAGLGLWLFAALKSAKKNKGGCGSCKGCSGCGSCPMRDGCDKKDKEKDG